MKKFKSIFRSKSRSCWCKDNKIHNLFYTDKTGCK